MNNMNMNNAMSCEQIQDYIEGEKFKIIDYIEGEKFRNELVYHTEKYHTEKKGDNNLFEQKACGQYKYMGKKTSNGISYMTTAGLIRLILSQQQQLIRLNYLNVVAEEPVVDAEHVRQHVADPIADPIAVPIAVPYYNY